jgi:transcriptional regulator with XRE-family HTH domain
MRSDSVTVQVSVGDRIRQRRLELGLSQRQLAGKGLSYAYISRLEANQRQPSIKALRQLASKLQVSVHWIETGRPDPAHQLAQLVLHHQGQPLPAQATTLAHTILERL